MVLKFSGENKLGVTVPVALAVSVFIAIFYFLFTIFLSFILFELLEFFEFELALYFDIGNFAKTPIGIAFVLSSFIGIWIALFIALYAILKRPLSVFAWSKAGFEWWIFAKSLGLFGAILAFLSLISLFFYGGGRSEIALHEWVLWLLPMLILLFIQTSAEEYVFRGFLQSVFLDWFGTRIAWMIIPSLLFASLHLQAELFGANARLVVFVTFLFGVLCAELTYRSGTIAWGLGLHFANNAIVLLFIGQKDGLGIPLYRMGLSSENIADFRIALFIQMLFFLLLFLVIYFKYPQKNHGLNLSD